MGKIEKDTKLTVSFKAGVTSSGKTQDAFNGTGLWIAKPSGQVLLLHSLRIRDYDQEEEYPLATFGRTMSPGLAVRGAAQIVLSLLARGLNQKAACLEMR